MPNQYTRDHLTPLQAAQEIAKILDRVQYGEARTLALASRCRSVRASRCRSVTARRASA